MKNYELKNYGNNIKDFAADFVADMTEAFGDLEITSTKYTDCEILEIEKIADDRSDVVVSISCNAGIIDFYFRKAVEAGLLILTDEYKKLLNDYMTAFDKVVSEFNTYMADQAKKLAEESEKIRLAREARIAEKAAKQAELEAKEKLAKRIAKVQKKFAEELKTKVAVDADPIEWLRQNTVSIIATVPTHLEKVFKAQFPDADYNLVDSSRKTSGGNSMKWSASFCLTVPKGSTIPAGLAAYFKDNKINNTSLIATLVRDEDFKFSKR